MDPGPHELRTVPGVRGLIHLTFSGVSHVPGRLCTQGYSGGKSGEVSPFTKTRSKRKHCRKVSKAFTGQPLPAPPASAYEPWPPAHCSPAAPMSLHPSNGACMLPTKDPTEALPAL